MLNVMTAARLAAMGNADRATLRWLEQRSDVLAGVVMLLEDADWFLMGNVFGRTTIVTDNPYGLKVPEKVVIAFCAHSRLKLVWDDLDPIVEIEGIQSGR